MFITLKLCLMYLYFIHLKLLFLVISVSQIYLTATAHVRIGKFQPDPKHPALITLVEKYLISLKIFTAVLITMNILFMGQIRDLVNDRWWWYQGDYSVRQTMMAENTDLTILGVMVYGIIAMLCCTLYYGTKYHKSIQAVASADPVLAKIIINTAEERLIESDQDQVHTAINESIDESAKQEEQPPINNVLWHGKAQE